MVIGGLDATLLSRRHIWYKLVDQENGITLGLYTNKNWDVGNTIHIGARWGKNYKE